ncbi:MAG: SRPBCC domain-containing protein [Candidatus Eisenbacteria bacterium]|uniref:SRPBCC domain-containing protein n=1 Tax=Eiseniibacteriota bacterium TaxID=2212470 RepID=A0A849SNL9_UNCEI|nr:SRPBCC domain-containing protein [Candidatus Eisenbacteria bacterium]
MTHPEQVLAFDRTLAAPPARLFDVLTEGRHLQAWFCDWAVSEPRAGGRLTLEWTRPGRSGLPFQATWTGFEPPLACAYEGGHAGYPPRSAADSSGYAGRVEFRLDPKGAVGGACRLRVTHTLPARPDYEPIAEQYRAAWPRALARLADYLAPRV